MRPTRMALAGLVLFLAGAARGQNVLQYQGVDEGDWVRQLKSTDAADRKLAATALGTIAEQVRTEFKTASDKAAKVVPSANRQLAVMGLRRLTDPVGRDAPALEDAAGKDADTDVQAKAKEALEKWQALAKDAVDFYRGRLQDDDFGPRMAAAEALGELGPLARDAIDDLQKNIRHPDDRVVKAATAALTAIQKGTTKPDPKRLETVRGMTMSLKAFKNSVKVQAAIGLGPLCKGDEAAARIGVQALAGALGDNDNYVRQKAAESLGQIGLLAKDAVPALHKAADAERDTDARKAEIEALKQIGE